MNWLDRFTRWAYGVGPGSVEKVVVGRVFRRAMIINLVLAAALILSFGLHLADRAPAVDELALEARVMEKVEKRLNEMGVSKATPEPVIVEKITEKVPDQETVGRSQENKEQIESLRQELEDLEKETEKKFHDPEGGVFPQLERLGKDIGKLVNETTIARTERRFVDESLRALAENAAVVSNLPEGDKWPEGFEIKPYFDPNSLGSVNKDGTKVSITFGKDSCEFILYPGDRLDVFPTSPEKWQVGVFRFEDVLEGWTEALQPEFYFSTTGK